MMRHQVMSYFPGHGGSCPPEKDGPIGKAVAVVAVAMIGFLRAYIFD